MNIMKDTKLIILHFSRVSIPLRQIQLNDLRNSDWCSELPRSPKTPRKCLGSGSVKYLPGCGLRENETGFSASPNYQG